MRLRRVLCEGAACVEIDAGGGFVSVADALARLPSAPSAGDATAWAHDMIAFLGAPESVRGAISADARQLAGEASAGDNGAPALPPFAPRSFRDFMIYERHAIDAARGFVRTFMPQLAPITRAWEAVSGRDFPAFKPKRLWYREPIFYMGNHLAFVTDGAVIERPRYSHALDYELELGFVLARGLRNATVDEAEAAIGGFVVVNDFSARDVQLAEMRSGFGPQKAKHFASAISSVLVSADEVLPRWRKLNGHVTINGRLVAEPRTAGARWSLGEMLAHASKGEHLHPGELLATGTLPGGSGIEIGRFLMPGDVIEIGIDRVGTLTNRVVDEEEAGP